MARYRNTGSMPLDYSGSGGPKVEPGQEFEHDIPPAMRDAHLEAGNITELPALLKKSEVVLSRTQQAALARPVKHGDDKD